MSALAGGVFTLPMSTDGEQRLRALTTLKWPYTGDEDSSFVDPLTRNDPKQLRTAHYEALGL
jgi:hypothetical protein